MATLAGEPLYRACGYAAIDRTVAATIDGIAVPLVRMAKALTPPDARLIRARQHVEARTSHLNEAQPRSDGKSVVSGQRAPARGDPGGRWFINNKNQHRSLQFS